MHKQEINETIIWNKTRTLKLQRKKASKKIKIPKCMANAYFYRLKFRTIDLMTNYWVGGHILT